MSNFLQLAREAKTASNVEEALKYYQKVREGDVDNVEAKFFCGYLNVLNTVKGAFTGEFVKFSKMVRTIIADLKSWEADEIEKQNLLVEIGTKMVTLPATSREIAYELYRIHPEGKDAVNMYISIAVGIKMLFELGDEISKYFPEYTKEASVEIWKAGIAYFEKFGYGMDGMALRKQDASITKEYCLSYVKKINKYEPDFAMKEKKPSLFEKILGVFKKK